ncbi:MAG: hypothetical protein RSD49_06590 [Hafnia sp.]
MQLLHGTTRQSLRGIESDGQINGPVFLTNNPSLARHFAKMQRRQNPPDYVILSVKVDPAMLSVDEQSLLDPVAMVREHLGITCETTYLQQIADSDENQWLRDLAQRQGYQSTLSDWELSLAMAWAVQHNGPISIRDIRVSEHQA